MIVLVDTSVWIEHFRKGRPDLADLLDRTLVLMHPFVLGELACGGLKDRGEVLRGLGSLPAVPLASHAETLHLLETRKLWSRGIGWIDAHLVASTLLANCWLWTLDDRLKAVAGETGVGFSGNV